ncbi:hypothetical protein [Actinocorallia lasiicapitis]
MAGSVTDATYLAEGPRHGVKIASNGDRLTVCKRRNRRHATTRHDLPTERARETGINERADERHHEIAAMTAGARQCHLRRRGSGLTTREIASSCGMSPVQEHSNRRHTAGRHDLPTGRPRDGRQ